jgi:hypothetical protein
MYECMYGEVTVEDRKSENRTTQSIVYYYLWKETKKKNRSLEFC